MSIRRSNQCSPVIVEQEVDSKYTSDTSNDNVGYCDGDTCKMSFESNSEYYKQEAASYKMKSRRNGVSCTNPITLLIFIGLLIFNGFMTIVFIKTSPEGKLIFTFDHMENMCGAIGGPLEEFPLLGYSVNLQALQQKGLDHFNGMMLLEWLIKAENDEDWILFQEELLELDMLQKVCLRNCANTHPIADDAVPIAIPDSFTFIDPSHCPYSSDKCVFLPMGLTEPMLDSICLPRLPTSINYATHPLTYEIIEKKYEWIASLPHIPFTLSRHALVNIDTLYTMWTCIPASLAFCLVLVTLSSALLPYFMGIITRLCMYSSPAVSLASVASGICLLLFCDEAVDSSICSSHTIVAPVLISIGAIGFVATTCVLFAMRRKLSQAREIVMDASIFARGLAVYVPAFVVLLLISGAVTMSLLGICARLMIEHQDLLRGLETERVSVTFMAWTNVLLLLWTITSFSAMGRICLALMAAEWAGTVQWSFIGRVKPSYLKQNVSQLRILKSGVNVVYYLGSACLGGFLTGATRIMKFIAKLTIKRLESLCRRSETANHLFVPEFLVKVLQFVRLVLSIIDKAVRFLSNQAYIHVALTNRSFIPSATNAFFLMMRQKSDVLSSVFLSRIVRLVITMCTTVCSVLAVIGMQMLSLLPFNEVEGSNTLTYACCFICCWCISAHVLRALTVGSDTLLHLCLLQRETLQQENENCNLQV